jgi:hypothetical protein
MSSLGLARLEPGSRGSQRIAKLRKVDAGLELGLLLCIE